MIFKKIEEQSWGKSVVDRLGQDLQAAIPGSRGYSRRNLYNMLDFYSAYRDKPIVQTLSAQISWSHNLLILNSLSDDRARCYYMEKTVEHGWSYRVLQHQIELKSFERNLTAQTNFKATLPAEVGDRLSETVKDHYVFDFLGLTEAHSERELELRILQRINHFLLEMGGVFAFVGNQFKLTVDEREFFIDILLFHRRLKCLVALELKIGDFEPEYAGKMQFYLNALDQSERQAGENPPIGIILCKSKTRTIVEYSLRDASRPLAVATYSVTETLPPALKDELPSVAQIESLLDVSEPSDNNMKPKK